MHGLVVRSVLFGLAFNIIGLNDPRNDAWQAWNLSRENARELLGR